MKNKAGAAILMGLATCVGAWLLLAGPASADPSSVGPNAVNNSTSSGSGVAINDSTASGDAVAINGSVASGCSTAINDSTASGGDCKPHRAKHADKAPAASVATPVASTNLAFTGAPTGPLAFFASALMVLGVALVLGTRRTQPSGS